MKLLLISLTILIGSCSSLTNLNQVSENILTLKGGRSEDLKWNNSLSFKRYSWFKGSTMKYDLLIAELTDDSPFYNWLGWSERSQLKDCDKFYITLSYAAQLLSTSTNRARLTENFNIVGIKKFILPIFNSSFRNHYFNLQWNLKNHRLVGICKSNNLSDVEVHIPNYETVKVFK